MPIVDIQRRMMELGRIRMGDKGAKGQPQKLSSFRLTSASRALLEAAAVLYGGTVEEWKDAPDPGYFELYTEAAELDVLLPPVLSMVDGHPTLPYSQYYELWSGGGCQRRCDGDTELISGGACMCDEEERTCKVTTRVSVMLPRVPGIGVWRLESHGWNAATELPGTLELLRLAAEGNRFIPAVLRIEHRQKKTPGEPLKKFIVPVIDLPGTTAAELVAGHQPLVLNPPATQGGKPELPAGEEPPANGEAKFENDAPPVAGFGEPPDLPDLGDAHLLARLREVAAAIRKEEQTEEAIEAAQTRYKADPGKFTGWLGRQVKAAEAKLETAGR